eukprot:1383232-Amorphochlora_amoeboformis.AAC.1
MWGPPHAPEAVAAGLHVVHLAVLVAKPAHGSPLFPLLLNSAPNFLIFRRVRKGVGFPQRGDRDRRRRRNMACDLPKSSGTTVWVPWVPVSQADRTARHGHAASRGA